MYQRLIVKMDKVYLITKCKYIEITYLENMGETTEKTCLLRYETLRKSLNKFNQIAPNRIITNIEFLFTFKE